jgi:hypothetical protein
LIAVELERERSRLSFAITGVTFAVPRGGPVTTTIQSFAVLSIAACFSIVSSPLSVVANAAPQTRGASTGASEACSLLTKEDATTALGESVKGPASSVVQDKSSCEYSGSGIHRVHLNVMHMAADIASMYKSLCAAKGKEGLTGLGDVTCWYNDKHEELQVLKGTTFFSIELRKNGDPTEAIKGVAKNVYGRLK